MHSGIHSHMEPEGFSKGGKLFGVDGICNSKDEVSAVRFGEFRRKCPPQHQNITFDPGTPQGSPLIYGGHCEGAHTLPGTETGDLDGAMAVAIRLDHGHQGTLRRDSSPERP